MEWNPETLQNLSQCFLHTLSPIPEPRRAAERSLSEAADLPNYGLAVLRLVAEPSVEEQTRHAAAVNFKNHLRSRWLPSADSGISPIMDSEKEQIKTLIVSLMLSSSPRIQSQLSEALAVIGKHDFPRNWPALLPELVSSLQKAALAGDYASVNGILGTANSIFKNFRHQYRTDELFLDIKYCLGIFALPLQEIFIKTDSLIDSAVSSGGSAANLKPLFESQKLCCRIFLSLNFQDLPEFFEDNMEKWMTVFKKCLSSNYPALESTADGLTLVDDLRAAVCENINLYMEKYEEEFRVFLEGFASAVWTLLRDVSKSPSRDQLATTAIKFLTTVSTSAHHALFAGENVIKEICQSIVIPNVSLREEDEELFEMNYIEFIRRDMEGSDVDTRRRIACELLKGLATNYKGQVIEVVSHEIQKLLSSFSTNPAVQWKDKDCAIYLVVSLATKKAGGASVSTDLIDVQSFFANIILPELQSQDVNSFPMLKAGSLKFLTMFRSHLPKPFAMQLFPELVRFLKAESNVVHSYAASCIEKLLLVKDEGGRSRYVAGDISPFLLQLMTNLFDALKFPESEENQYIMKCIMRVLGVAEISSEVAGPCIGGLTSVLSEVCKNPKNPTFNHYIFESVAVLVRRACERDISLISAFETSLFPSLQMILANDIAEFLPYAFQLLAQLVELNRPPLSPNYMQIFLLLLSPESWKRSGNVPALVRLLQAFLQKAPHEVTQENRLNQVLGIFNKLVAAPSTDEQGFYVLNTVIEYLDYGAIAPFMTGIWSALFTRLQNKKTLKFQKSLVVFMSLFVVKHGHAHLVDTMNTVQPNIFTAIVQQIWIPNVKLIMGSIEVKLTAVAATRLICETPALLNPAASNIWGAMLDSIVTLISRPEQERAVEEPEMPEGLENAGYTAAFVSLHNAGRREADPLPDIRDPKQFVVASLARLSAASPGRYPQIIGENLEKANQAALLQLCSAYSSVIV
ncbi:Exportin-2 [Raphanus sativus]|uniref:Exportin-2 n=1 Tax=Raphanus sativus TaxID=3726 RepID=A0A6J0JXS4_RAPSA|nr:exportin-2 [Raphanus sativus]KAJ4892444.1 Exportin-2 [Raphanus sativus]